MIVLSQVPFRPPKATRGRTTPWVAGLIIQVGLSIDNWCSNQTLSAEAFIDPGADCTWIRWDWITAQSNAFGKGLPPIGPRGELKWPGCIEVNNHRFRLESPLQPMVGTRIVRYKNVPFMPGDEDILIGRDFLSHHGFTLIVHGQSRSHSLIWPHDAANLRRVAKIVEAVDPLVDPRDL